MLRWFVGQYHVGTPTWEIGQAVRKKAHKALSREATADMIIRARKIHLENREVYRHVMGGIS